ncbi:MAG: methyl-accepting chemotaxis protein [Magnetococcales bacterium]|nr:methyl-accepting chemotaxis protein [Magnetococcales bacterium]
MTLQAKLMMSFAAVTLLVFVAGVPGMKMVGDTSDLAHRVIDRLLPIKERANNALLALTTLTIESQNYLAKTNNLDDIRKKIDQQRDLFDRFIQIKSIIGIGNTSRLLEENNLLIATFNAAVESLLAAHDRQAALSFSLRGRAYHIPSFLDHLRQQLHQWQQVFLLTLHEKAPFEGDWEASASDFGLWYPGFKTDDKTLARLLQEYAAVNATLHRMAQAFAKSAPDDRRAIYHTLRQEQFVLAERLLDQMQNHIVPVFEEAQGEERAGLETLAKTGAKIRSNLENLQNVIDQEIKRNLTLLDEREALAKSVTLWTSALSVVVAFFLSLLLTSLIKRSIQNTVQMAVRLADRDLTIEIKPGGRDEIGQLKSAMGKMVDQFKEIIGMVAKTSERITNTSDDITASVDREVVTATDQSASVVAITSSMEQLSKTSTLIANHAASVLTIATNTLQLTEDGQGEVQTLIRKMDEIQQNNKHSIHVIIQLGRKSQEITKVMEIINNIADQTKLIAFNAAIESSRAGKAGSSFSVVAEEIRRLADNVTESIDETRTTIQDIQEVVNNLVDDAKNSADTIEEGKKLTGRTANVFSDIVQGSRSTTQAMSQISLSTEQQKTASDQIVHALHEIETGSTQISDSIQQTRTNCQSLQDLSNQLKDQVSKFRLKE